MANIPTELPAWWGWLCYTRTTSIEMLALRAIFNSFTNVKWFFMSKRMRINLKVCYTMSANVILF